MVGSGLYEGFYKQNINIVKNRFLKKNYDWVQAVTGYEGIGKTTLAIQTCLEIEPDFDLSKVCFTPKQYMSAVEVAKKRTAVLYDEAGTGLFTREAMGRTNITINKILMTVRAKNLFHCLVLPNFFALDRNISQNRVSSWVEITRRGHFAFWSRKRLRNVALKGAVEKQKPNFYDTFGKENRFEREYNKLKTKYLQEYFDSMGIHESVGQAKMKQLVVQVTNKIEAYSSEWRGKAVVDVSLLMHDFQISRNSAVTLKKMVERSLKDAKLPSI